MPRSKACGHGNDDNHGNGLHARVRLKFREPPEHQFTDDLYPVTLFRNVFAYIIYIIKEVAEGVK